MGFLWQEYWSGLPFPPPMGHVLSELFALTCLSLVTLHSMAHSFIDLCKSLCYNKAVIHERVLMNMVACFFWGGGGQQLKGKDFAVTSSQPLVVPLITPITVYLNPWEGVGVR